MNTDKLTDFAALLAFEQATRFKREYPNLEPPTVNAVVGRKYTKVDVGSSGKYMVDSEGNIFGVKGYGKVRKGHRYGTLDTIHEWDWSGYVGVKKAPS